MTGFFSRLAHRTGVRIGGAGHRSETVGGVREARPATPLEVAPLEVDEVRAVSAPGAGRGRPGHPPIDRGDEARREGVRRIVPQVKQEAPRERDLSHDMLQDRHPPESHARGTDESLVNDGPPVPHRVQERFETRIVEGDAGRGVPSEPREPVVAMSHAVPPEGPSGRQDLDEVAAVRREPAPVPALEEYVMKMIGEDLNGPGSAGESSRDERSRIGEEPRALLREVIEWISSPPPSDVQMDERENRLPEEERLVEIGGDGALDRRESRVIDRGIELYADEDRSRARDGRESDIQDVTLSIGSIRVVIEEPQSHAPPVVPARAEAARTETASRTADGSSRLSRHYIMIG